jgi:hypothetical protein
MNVYSCQRGTTFFSNQVPGVQLARLMDMPHAADALPCVVIAVDSEITGPRGSQKHFVGDVVRLHPLHTVTEAP